MNKNRKKDWEKKYNLLHIYMYMHTQFIKSICIEIQKAFDLFDSLS